MTRERRVRTEAALLQRIIDGCELGIELGAHPVHYSDNSERDARRDQAILDGGGAGFVSYKFASEIDHPAYLYEEV
jgi:hypothetical protein